MAKAYAHKDDYAGCYHGRNTTAGFQDTEANGSRWASFTVTRTDYVFGGVSAVDRVQITDNRYYKR